MDLAFAGRLLAACVVVALVLGGLQVAMRYAVRARARGGRLVDVLETTLLPGAASLHVVRVGEAYRLIGRSGAHIADLGEVSRERVDVWASGNGRRA